MAAGDQGEDVLHGGILGASGNVGKRHPCRGIEDLWYDTMTERCQSAGESAATGREASRVLVIAGPTASGKSALALAVAERFSGVVINADAMQVYRHVEILTAQPAAAARARVPHRLYGTVAPGEACSAGRWREMALDEIAAALGHGKLPVVVGGTGLYLKALMEGLAPIPEVPGEVRASARELHARLGGAAFHQELRRLDPETAARLDPGDSQRLIRAWEVLRATGRSLISWHGAEGVGAPPGLAFKTVMFDPPRQALYAACEARFEHMIANGAIEEARALEARGLDPELPVMKALGVRELLGFIQGAIGIDEAVSRAKQATRNYAKRQLTWFRRQMNADEVISAQYSESFNEPIFSFIMSLSLTADR
jgi:tRNA dimethylallyltransferase